MVKLILFVALSFFLQGALGGIICEQLPMQLCSYSVSASGNRCLLENFAASDGTVTYQCKTSGVVVDVIHDWIETDECINACGVDRKSVGISSDSLIQPQFTARLCSDACYQNCPNIVDLYFNLALGEGVYLPALCQVQQINPRRAMSDIKSSGVAWGPSSSTSSGVAWGPSSSRSGEAWAAVSSSTGSGESSSPAPSPAGYAEASSLTSSTEAWSPAPSPTGYSETWVPSPSPRGSGAPWSLASSSTGDGEAWSPTPSPSSSSEAGSPVLSPIGYAWGPGSS